MPPYPPQQQTNIKCTIQWDTDVDAYIVSTPYSKQFVDFIKVAIPVSDRAWHPETKVWYIKESYFDVVKTVALKVWLQSEIVIISKDDAVAQQARKTSVAAVAKAPLNDVLIEFVRLCPKDALKSAYRTAALALHPDRNNGDGSKMSALNTLWNRIEQELLTK